MEHSRIVCHDFQFPFHFTTTTDNKFNKEIIITIGYALP